MDEENVSREHSRYLRLSQALSIAFSRRQGYGILLVVDDAQVVFNSYTRDQIDHILKVFVVIDDTTLLDVTGRHDRGAIEGRYLRSNIVDGSYRLIELKGEAQLASFISDDWDYSLSPVSDAEIEAVFSDFLARHPEYLPVDRISACGGGIR